MAVRFQLRRDTAANFASVNPVLALGEPGVETDTLKVKIGDGSTAWNSLGYSITKDFTDLSNKPTTISGYGIVDAVTLTALSVTQNSASGNGTLSYNNSTGVFEYTPPDLTLMNSAVQPGDLFVGDVKGSVFADDSTVLIDGVNSTINLANNSITGLSDADQTVRTTDDVTFNSVTGNIFTSLIDSSDSSAITVTPDVVLSAGLTVGNHILPSSNVNIDLGSATNRFRDLYLSGSTINLGGAVITKGVGNTVSLPVGTNIGGVNVAAPDQSLDTTDNVTFANITATGYIAGPATFTIDPAAVGDNTGTVVIAGNLQVDGTTTTINSTTLDVDDKNINLSVGSPNAAGSDGAGITVDNGTDADATITYDGINDEWEINKDLIVSGLGDFTGNSLSLGNTSAGILNIKGGSTTSPQIRFFDGGAAQARIGVPTGQTYLSLSGSDTLTADVVIDSSGNVGIGATPESWSGFTALQIGGGASFLGQSGTDEMIIGANVYNDGSWKRISNNYATIYQQSNQAHIWYSDAPNTQDIAFTPTERMRISSNGFLGIGTDNPQYDLHIADTSPILALQDTDTETVFALNASSTSGIIQYQTDVTSVGSNPEHWFKAQGRFLAKIHDNADFSWYEDTGSSVEMFWDASAGNLGIGTTSPVAPIDALTNSTVYAGRFIQSNTANGDGVLVEIGSTASSDYALSVRSDGGNTPVLSAKADGNVGIGTFTPDVLLDVGNSDHGSAGNTGIQIQSSQDFSTTYDGTSANTWPGVQIVNHDDTANRTAAGITFVHRSSSSGIAAIQSTSNAADRADIRFITRGTGNAIAERVIIDYDGNVGIGISSPEEKLDLGANLSQNLRAGLRTYLGTGRSTAGTILGHSVKADIDATTGDSPMEVTETNSAGGAPAAIRMQYGEIEFHTAASGTAGADFDSERMRIDTTGRVGIGVTDPGAALEVNRNSAAFTAIFGAPGGSGKAVLFKDNDATPSKYNYLVGTQYNINNGFEITPSTTVGGTTFSNPAITVLENGNVGIGTNSPDNKLHIQNGDASASSNANANLTIESSSSINVLQFLSPNTAQQQIRFGDPQDDGNGYIAYNHSGVHLSFGVNGPEKMRIDSSGNVGLGTQSPTTNLTIGMADLGSAEIDFRAESYSRLGIIKVSHDSGAAESSMRFHTRTGGSEPERMRIDNNGNVGIGTSVLSVFNGVGGVSSLVVRGSDTATNVANNSDASITISNGDGTADNTAALHFAREDTDLSPHFAGASIVAQFQDTQVTGQYPKADMVFLTSTAANTAPSEKMRIHAAGAVLHTSSLGEVIPGNLTAHTIHQHDSANRLLNLQHSGGAGVNGVLIDFDQVANDNNTQYFFSCDDSVTNRLVIWSDGDIDNHDNSYGAISDQKLKEQITDASSQWNDIKDLRIRKFKFKSDVSEKGDSDELWRLGLIAQEAELVSPNIVKTKLDFDKQNNPILDEEGNQTETKSVKYSILYMKAVKALQEAMQKIEDLEARVNILEGN